MPDDRTARLVVLGVDAAHAKEASPAIAAARAILESRGSSPRLFQNELIFLAPDQARIADLCEAVARYLAWESILDDREPLNLTGQQVKQAESQKAAADTKADAQIPETFCWILVPTQKSPQGALEWQPIRQSGAEALAVRASARLVRDELLITSFGASTLRMELDRVPLWRGDHVEIRQLTEDFAKYPYLPRLAEPSVLVTAVRKGFELLTWEKDSFAFAESYDEKEKRYRGLVAGQAHYFVEREPAGLLVKPDAAKTQLEAEEEERKKEPGGHPVPGPGPKPGPGGPKPKPTPERKLRRFHGSVVLDETRVGRDAGQIADEIIGHLAGLPKANVTVTLEIEAEIPDGAPENVVRTVTENAQALKFRSQGFESE